MHQPISIQHCQNEFTEKYNQELKSLDSDGYYT